MPTQPLIRVAERLSFVYSTIAAEFITGCFFRGLEFLILTAVTVVYFGRVTYRSIQNYYRQTFILRAINFQLQIQNPAARRMNFHYRNRSVGMSAENLSLQIQILS